jgi:hypothetical protein
MKIMKCEAPVDTITAPAGELKNDTRQQAASVTIPPFHNNPATRNKLITDTTVAPL